MKLKLLRSPLDKGEPWEQKNNRFIEIAQSLDNRGAQPCVYFGIFDNTDSEIIEDFFLPPMLAKKIGTMLIEKAYEIETRYKQ